MANTPPSTQPRGCCSGLSLLLGVFLLALSPSLTQCLPQTPADTTVETKTATVALPRMPVAAPPLTRASLNVTERDCCNGLGLTFDRCSTLRGCAQPRFCLKEYTMEQCEYGQQICHCRSIALLACTSPSQCPLGETCAARPDEPSYCYSIEVVEVNPSFVIHDGPCCQSGTKPPPTRMHTTTYTTTTTKAITDATTTTTYTTTTGMKETYTTTTGMKETYTTTTSKPPMPNPTPYPSYPSSAIPPSVGPKPTEMESPIPYVPSSAPPVTIVPLPPSPSSGMPITSTSPEPSGLTGEECNPTRRCKSYRKCASPEDRKPCASCSGVCIYAKVCRCTDECLDGEVCAGAQGQSYCFSPKLIGSLDWVVTYPCTTQGLTGDKCTDAANCIGGRRCVQGGGTCASENVLCSGSRPDCTPDHPYGCYCDKPQTCECSHDCQDAEFCCTTPYGNQCVSRSVVDGSTVLEPLQCENELKAPTGSIYVVADLYPKHPDGREAETSPFAISDASSSDPDQESTEDSDQSPKGTENSGVCIDARSLRHLERHELVFEDHVRSEVLCDGFNSCATRGHLVLYHGEAMMMSSYCKLVPCVRRIAQVNSPKYRRRFTVKSNTDGLVFTVHAARFGTRGEEIVLKAAVHVGL